MMQDQKQTNHSLEGYVNAAMAAGCPINQIERFISFGYVAQPKQLEFSNAARACDVSDGPTEIALGGARGGSKSHGIMAQVGLDDCQRQPELKVLFLRKIQKAAKESFEDLIRHVFSNINHKYNQNDHRLIFPNGSRIIIGGYKDEKDIDGYLGIEYDVIAIEEATLLTEMKVELIKGSLRTSKASWRPRMYYSTNPGGIGHVWFKTKFVIPYRNHTETKTRFIPSTYRDNAFLNPEYREYLEGLKGALGKAWRDGDWDVFEGQAFPTWDYESHVLKYSDFPDVPDHWVKWRAIDWGSAAPFCCLWFTREPDTRRIIVYREAYQAGLTVPQQARMILDMNPPTENIPLTYADPSMWAKNTVKEEITSTADEYLKHGIPLTRADNDRLSGKRKVEELLADLADGMPGLQVRENCVNFIRTFPSLSSDENNPEDVDTKQEDHAYDALRYGLTSLRIAQPNLNKVKQTRSPLSGVFGYGR